MFLTILLFICFFYILKVHDSFCKNLKKHNQKNENHPTIVTKIFNNFAALLIFQTDKT